MRLITLFSAALLCLYLFTLPAWSISGGNTYVFAASACPPWKTKLLEKNAKHIALACQNDVELFTSSVKKALNIPSENIFTLVDEQATYDGLQEGLIEFADKVPKGSRVIMLFNFHGELSGITQAEKPGKDEVLVLWTKDKPFTVLSALALKQWITAKELRGMIDALRAEEIVVTIDACNSGGAVHDILKKHGRDEDWQGREAVMTSSKAEQYSYFTMDGTHGLFTLNLSDSIRSGFPTLKRAFENAAKETSKYIDINEKKCAHIMWDTLHKRIRCVQTPVVYDPTNLLPTIKLNATNSVLGP